MDLLVILFVSIVLIATVVKYRIKGVLYLSGFMLPFRMVLFSVSDVDFRLNDIFYIILILTFTITSIKNIDKIKVKGISVIFGFYCIMLLSIIFNVHRIQISSALISLFRTSLAVFSGYFVAKNLDKEEKKKFIKYWVFSSVVVGIITVGSFMLNPENLKNIFQIFSLNVADFYALKFTNSLFFEDPNNFAGYLLISIFLLIYYLQVVKKRKKIISILLISLLLFTLFLSLSRSAYIGFLVGAMGIYIFMTKKGKIVSQIALISIPFFVSIAAIIVYDRLIQDVSAYSRLELWAVGIKMSFNNPVFGVGLSNSTNLFYQYAQNNLIINNPHFHNLFLKISAELGIVGLFCFMIMLWKIFKQVFINSKNPKNIMIFGMAAFLTQSIFVEYFESRHFWLLLVFLYYEFNTRGARK
ncbi:O-antigen ligase family protein [Acholeplasma laidlawii]|uniref:O-antigen ligase family protein n=1 Tax=Acholeplasma laidlawii TaxID=2148 RepID=UPI0018C2A600|nr:O-antigen ligase family protein [Acholeplasma laidlawii]MBG0763196.1 O-antigen ligase family protein [Acholeplasma laidlawii]